jgi:hypothetical protein
MHIHQTIINHQDWLELHPLEYNNTPLNPTKHNIMQVLSLVIGIVQTLWNLHNLNMHLCRLNKD